jgi:hypothetical protein
MYENPTSMDYFGTDGFRDNGPGQSASCVAICGACPYNQAPGFQQPAKELS